MSVNCDMEWPTAYRKHLLSDSQETIRVIATNLPDIPYSPHRSKRLWKKLRKKGSRPRYSHVILISSKNTADKVVERLLNQKTIRIKR